MKYIVTMYDGLDARYFSVELRDNGTVYYCTKKAVAGKSYTKQIDAIKRKLRKMRQENQ